MTFSNTFPFCPCCAGSSSSSSSQSGVGCCVCCLFLEGGNVSSTACGGITIPAGLYYMFNTNEGACSTYSYSPELLGLTFRTSTEDQRLGYSIKYVINRWFLTATLTCGGPGSPIVSTAIYQDISSISLPCDMTTTYEFNSKTDVTGVTSWPPTFAIENLDQVSSPMPVPSTLLLTFPPACTNPLWTPGNPYSIPLNTLASGPYCIGESGVPALVSLWHGFYRPGQSDPVTDVSNITGQWTFTIANTCGLISVQISAPGDGGSGENNLGALTPFPPNGGGADVLNFGSGSGIFTCPTPSIQLEW